MPKGSIAVGSSASTVKSAQFAHLNAALQILLESGVGSVQRVDARTSSTEMRWFRPHSRPSLSVRGHAALYAHQRLEWPRRVVGGAGGHHVVVHERALGEHPLQAFLAVELHFLAVVIDVGAEGSGHGSQPVHPREQVGIDQGAMLNSVAWVGSRIGSLRRLVGFEHQVDGGVAVGVNAHLKTGGVHLHDVAHDLVAGHGQDAVVATAAHVWLRQVRRPRRYRSVGHHLDAADAQPVVAHAGADARLPQCREVAIPHDGIHPQAEVAASRPSW